MSDALEPPSPRRRWPRVVAWAAGLLLLGAMVGYHAFLAQLDQPYLKRAFNAILSLPHGVQLDYRRLDLAPLSGRLLLEGLTITSPEPHRRYAPYLLHVDRLALQWSARSLLGREIRIDTVEIGPVRVHDVVQEQGPSTWELLAEPKPTHQLPSIAAGEHEPRSTALAFGWLPRAVSLDRFSLGDIEVVRTELDADGGLARRLELRGLRLTAGARLRPGHVDAQVTVTSPADTPTRLTIQKTGHVGASVAELHVIMAAQVIDSRSVVWSGAADLLAQTIDPSFAVGGRVVDMEGTAEMDPALGMVRLAVKRFELLKGAVSAQFTAALADGATLPTIVGTGRAHLDPLLKLKTGLVPGLDGHELYVDGRFSMDQEHDGQIGFEVTARAGRLSWRQPDGRSVALERAALDLRGAMNPEVGGGFVLDAPVALISYRDGQGRLVNVEDVRVSVESPVWALDGHTLSSASGDVSAGPVRVGDDGASGLPPALREMRFRWALDEATLSPVGVPVSGRMTATGLADQVIVSAAGSFHDDDAGVQVTLDVDRLGSLARWLPDLSAYRIPLERIGVRLSVEGRYRRLGQADGPDLHHTLSATVTGVSLAQAGFSLAVPVIDLHGQHERHRSTERAAVDIELQRAVINGVRTASHPRVTASVQSTGSTAKAQVDLRLGPALEVAVQAQIDASAGTLVHRERLRLDHARALTAWLPPPRKNALSADWSKLTLALDLQGTIEGLVTAAKDQPWPALTNTPWNALTANHSLTIDLHGVALHDGAMAVALPHGRLAAAAAQRAGRLTGRLEVTAPGVDLEGDGHEVRLTSMRQAVEFSADAVHLLDGDISLHLTGDLAEVAQDYVPWYPIADVTLAGRAHISRLETFVLDDLTLRNKGGGTTVSLSKSLNRAGGPSPGGAPRPSLRELTLRGRFSQSLAELSRPAGAFQGQGLVTAPLTVYSSDGSLFNIAASLQLDDVSLHVPEAGLHVEAASGRIQLEETLEWDAEEGISVVHDSQRNHFSRNRYQDAQPFIANQSGFTIERVRWQDRSMGPIVGSLHVKNNVVSLNKLKIQKNHGIISGQLIYDYYPGAEQVVFRGNITGVRLGKGNQRVDGNMAVVFVPAKLELDGRIQILQLSRQHLEDLLDLLDPFREDRGLNRVRLALAFGYPKFARMELSQGLAAMKVELAGIGGLLAIDEIRGIALGPFMTRHVEPLIKSVWADPRDEDPPSVPAEVGLTGGNR